MEVTTLSNFTLAEVLDAFEAAFADYAVSFSRDQLESMLQRRGFTPALSAAVVNDGSIIAFVLNGVAEYHGKLTAYDIGTGTLPEFRGRRLTDRLIEHCREEFSLAGVQSCLLEVLSNNEPAIAIYKRQGYSVTREFICHTAQASELRVTPAEHPICKISEADVDAIEPLAGFCDFVPSWQNGMASIRRGYTRLRCFLAIVDGEESPVGYGVIDPTQGDIAQIAVARNWRRKGVARSLLAEMLGCNQATVVKALNIESTCRSLPAFLSAFGIGESSRQFEMMRTIG